FLFREGENGTDINYTLKETLNPDINRQIYEAAKVLLDEDHYVDVSFQSDDPSRVFLSLSKGAGYARNGHHYFKFVFYEKTGYNHKSDSNYAHALFSENVSISFTLGRLWHSCSDWVETFYANKMKSSFIAIFGK